MVVRGFCQLEVGYTQPIAGLLRQQLRFRQELMEFVTEFWAQNVPAGWATSMFVRVGVQVRRGDFLGRCMGACRRIHGRRPAVSAASNALLRPAICASAIPGRQQRRRLEPETRDAVDVQRHQRVLDALLASCM